jgi:transglutaminase-like putative cysteine protease
MSMLMAVGSLRLAHGDHGTNWLGVNPRHRMQRVLASVAGAAALATLAGVVVGPALPGAGDPALIDPDIGRRSEVVSPLVDIRSRLVNRSDREMFTVRASEPAYWRLTALDTFDGTTWTSNLRLTDVEGQFASADGPLTRQQYEIRALGERWIPTAAGVVFVDSPTRQLSYDPESGSLFLNSDAGELYTGMTYETLSLVRRPAADDVRALGVGTAKSRYLQLPDDYPDALRELASAIVGAAPTPYDTALALQNYFRDNFTYNLNIPRGHSERAIETFLRSREGYCEQFAGTFAAFARSVGLPARVAVGFTPGVSTGNGSYSVLGRHAHAWPEVYFDTIGWLPFEPTPGRGAPGAEPFTGVPAAQDGGGVAGGTDAGTGARDSGDRPPTETLTPPPGGFNDPDAVPSPSTAVPSGATAIDAEEAPRRSWVPLLTVLAGLVGAVAIWMALMPAVVRRLRRRATTPADRVVRAWEEATRAQAMLGSPRRPSETPIEHAQRATAETALARHATLELAQRATLALYASDSVQPEQAEASEVLAKRVVVAGRKRARLRTRLWARVNPAMVPSA